MFVGEIFNRCDKRPHHSNAPAKSRRSNKILVYMNICSNIGKFALYKLVGLDASCPNHIYRPVDQWPALHANHHHWCLPIETILRPGIYGQQQLETCRLLHWLLLLLLDNTLSTLIVCIPTQPNNVYAVNILLCTKRHLHHRRRQYKRESHGRDERKLNIVVAMYVYHVLVNMHIS